MKPGRRNEITIRSSAAEYLTFVAATGDDQRSVEMRYEDENIWLTQKMMATLYDIGVNTVNYHLKNIFDDNELKEGATIRKFRIVQTDFDRFIKLEAATKEKLERITSLFNELYPEYQDPAKVGSKTRPKSEVKPCQNRK